MGIFILPRAGDLARFYDWPSRAATTTPLTINIPASRNRTDDIFDQFQARLKAPLLRATPVPTCAALVSLLIAGQGHGLAQNQCGQTGLAPKTVRATLPVTAGWFNGHVVTNFRQGNVIPSAPFPAGPTNTVAGYVPLWQVSLVTRKPGVAARVLTSQADVLAAVSGGSVSPTRTGIAVNCTVVNSPLAGIMPGVILTTSR